MKIRRSQWLRGLRRRSTADRLLRSWVRIPPRAWMFVCYVLSGRGLCDGLIIRSEESYRLWRVVVCDHETSHARRLKPARALALQPPSGVVAPGEKNVPSLLTILVHNPSRYTKALNKNFRGAFRNYSRCWLCYLTTGLSCLFCSEMQNIWKEHTNLSLWGWDYQRMSVPVPGPTHPTVQWVQSLIAAVKVAGAWR